MRERNVVYHHICYLYTLLKYLIFGGGTPKFTKNNIYFDVAEKVMDQSAWNFACSFLYIISIKATINHIFRTIMLTVTAQYIAKSESQRFSWKCPKADSQCLLTDLRHRFLIADHLELANGKNETELSDSRKQNLRLSLIVHQGHSMSTHPVSW